MMKKLLSIMVSAFVILGARHFLLSQQKALCLRSQFYSFLMTVSFKIIRYWLC